MANDSKRANLWLNLAYTRRRLEDFSGGLEAVEQALALAPGLARAWAEKALLLVKLGRFQEALAAAEQGKRLDPADATVAGAVVQTLYNLGRYDEAKCMADQVVTMSPDNPHAKEWRDYLDGLFHRRTPDKSFTLSDGRRLEYIEIGDPNGLPIIACHGTPGSRLDWDTDDTIFRELYLRLIAPDRPGYGHSQAKRNMRLLDYPDDVRELADHLGVARFTVLGSSGGGPYALACAYALKDRIAGLGLVSSAPPGPGLVADFPLRVRFRIRMAQWLPRPLYRGIHELAARTACRFPSDWAEFEARRTSRAGTNENGAVRHLSPVERERITEPYRQGGVGHFLDDVSLPRPLAFALADITTPAYIWHGEKDVVSPSIIGHYLAEHVPNCHATFYPDEGHALFATHSREILATLAGAARGEVVTGNDRL